MAVMTVKTINGTKQLVPLSGATPVDIVQDGNMNAVTSNAVARNNVHCIRNYWTEDSNNPYDILSLAETFPLLSGASADIKIRVGSYATNSPYGASVQNCDFYYVVRKLEDSNYIRVIAYDIRSNNIYENAKVNGTWQGWVQLSDMRVNYVPVTIDTSHITTPDNSRAWVTCFRNGKVVTVTVEVSNGSMNLTANSVNRLAFGCPIPANVIVNCSIAIENFSVYKRVWIENGNLYAWVGANYIGNFAATVTYIEA